VIYFLGIGKIRDVTIVGKLVQDVGSNFGL
jgi:hypothetical protein